MELGSTPFQLCILRRAEESEVSPFFADGRVRIFLAKQEGVASYPAPRLSGAPEKGFMASLSVRDEGTELRKSRPSKCTYDLKDKTG